MNNGTMPDCAFMTFYFNDGTKETVLAHTYGMGLSKLTKEQAIAYHPFWQQGKGEGRNSMTWVKEQGWILTEDAEKIRSDEDLTYKAFDTVGEDINCAFEIHQVKPDTLNGETVMRIAGFDSDCTYITKQQAMDFFGLIERE